MEPVVKSTQIKKEKKNSEKEVSVGGRKKRGGVRSKSKSKRDQDAHIGKLECLQHRAHITAS